MGKKTTEELKKVQKILEEKAQQSKQKLIEELGAVDFHFQIPNFENPINSIGALTNELIVYGNAMSEFFADKLEAGEIEDPRELMKLFSFRGMWEVWVLWNTAIGMVVTGQDPILMENFHHHIVKFVETNMQGMNPNKKGN